MSTCFWMGFRKTQQTRLSLHLQTSLNGYFRIHLIQYRSRDYGYSTGKSVGHVTPFGRRVKNFVVRFNIGDVAGHAENGDN
ncbi:unnamed protein product [Brassica oleracea]